MKFISLRRSDKPEKKYAATVETETGREKTIHFGDASMKDYTLFSAGEREARKRAYLSRHERREDWTDPTTAGFWSRWILWGPYTNVTENLKFAVRKFKL